MNNLAKNANLKAHKREVRLLKEINQKSFHPFQTLDREIQHEIKLQRTMIYGIMSNQPSGIAFNRVTAHDVISIFQEV